MATGATAGTGSATLESVSSHWDGTGGALVVKFEVPNELDVEGVISATLLAPQGLVEPGGDRLVRYELLVALDESFSTVHGRQVEYVALGTEGEVWLDVSRAVRSAVQDGGRTIWVRVVRTDMMSNSVIVARTAPSGGVLRFGIGLTPLSTQSSIPVGTEPPGDTLAEPTLASERMSQEIRIGNNPTRHGTEVQFNLAESGTVTLDVYDLAGRRVYTRQLGYHSAGPTTASWNGTDGDGRPTGSGVYFIRISSGGFSSTRKVTVVR